MALLDRLMREARKSMRDRGHLPAPAIRREDKPTGTGIAPAIRKGSATNVETPVK